MSTSKLKGRSSHPNTHKDKPYAYERAVNRLRQLLRRLSASNAYVRLGGYLLVAEAPLSGSAAAAAYLAAVGSEPQRYLQWEHDGTTYRRWLSIGTQNAWRAARDVCGPPASWATVEIALTSLADGFVHEHDTAAVLRAICKAAEVWISQHRPQHLDHPNLRNRPFRIITDSSLRRLCEPRGSSDTADFGSSVSDEVALLGAEFDDEWDSCLPQLTSAHSGRDPEKPTCSRSTALAVERRRLVDLAAQIQSAGCSLLLQFRRFLVEQGTTNRSEPAINTIDRYCSVVATALKGGSLREIEWTNSYWSEWVTRQITMCSEPEQAAICRFLDYLHQECGVDLDDPKFEKIRKESSVTVFLNPKDVEAAANFISSSSVDPHTRGAALALLAIGAAAPVRISECLDLRMGDFERRETGEGLIRLNQARGFSGGKSAAAKRCLVIAVADAAAVHDWMLHRLAQGAESSDLLFGHPMHNGCIYRRSLILRLLNDSLKAASGEKGSHFHLLRHWHASKAIAVAVRDARQERELLERLTDEMGHSDPATIWRWYFDLDDYLLAIQRDTGLEHLLLKDVEVAHFAGICRKALSKRLRRRAHHGNPLRLLQQPYPLLFDQVIRWPALLLGTQRAGQPRNPQVICDVLVDLCRGQPLQRLCDRHLLTPDAVAGLLRRVLTLLDVAGLSSEGSKSSETGSAKLEDVIDRTRSAVRRYATSRTHLISRSWVGNAAATVMRVCENRDIGLEVFARLTHPLGWRVPTSKDARTLGSIFESLQVDPAQIEWLWSTNSPTQKALSEPCGQVDDRFDVFAGAVRCSALGTRTLASRLGSAPVVRIVRNPSVKGSHRVSIQLRLALLVAAASR